MYEWWLKKVVFVLVVDYGGYVRKFFGEMEKLVFFYVLLKMSFIVLGFDLVLIKCEIYVRFDIYLEDFLRVRVLVLSMFF